MTKKPRKTVVQTANVLVIEKEEAEKYAMDQGFDSLQAALRFIIKKMANKSLNFSISDNLVPYQVERQIGDSIEDIKQGNTVPYQGNIADTLRQSP